METERSVTVQADCPPRIVAALARDFTMATRDQIPALWGAFFQTEARIEHAKPVGMFGVSFGQDGAGGFRYGVGVEVTEEPATLPDGFCTITLAQADYAVLRAYGPMAQLPAAFDWLFSTWMPENGYSPAMGAVFEHYPPSDRNTPEIMDYEIWAPVAKRA